MIESCKIKVKCTQCGEKFIVFDDEKNGYDAISTPVFTLPPVNSVFKQKNAVIPIVNFNFTLQFKTKIA